MTMLLAEWGFALSRRLTQIGLIAGGVGGGLIAAGAAARLWRDHVSWLWLLFLGGVLVAAGAVLLVIAVHWGVNPYSPR